MAELGLNRQDFGAGAALPIWDGVYELDPRVMPKEDGPGCLRWKRPWLAEVLPRDPSGNYTYPVEAYSICRGSHPGQEVAVGTHRSPWLPRRDEIVIPLGSTYPPRVMQGAERPRRG